MRIARSRRSRTLLADTPTKGETFVTDAQETIR
jgi:hypothetical protein